METIIIGLFILIGCLFGYIIYMEKENRIERERLQLKLMSRDVTEYKDAISPPDKDTPEQRDTYLPLDDFSPEQLAEAEDNI